MCNRGEISWLHTKELVKYQLERKRVPPERGDSVVCRFVTNPLVGSKLIECVRELPKYTLPLMALPRKVAVRFAHVHNTPSSRILSVWDDDIVYSHGNMGQKCIASWSCRRFQGFGCSPMKAVRELGLVRWETVRILSFSGVPLPSKLGRGKKTERVILLYERTENDEPLVYQLSRLRHSWVAKFKPSNCWKPLKQEMGSQNKFPLS